MKTTTKYVLGAALPVLLLSGCSDWLSGPELDTDPNRPTTATRSVLLTGVQAQSFLTLEGSLARLAGLLTQQLAGTASQHRDYSQYLITENDLYQEYAEIYGGGGLLDIRKIREMSVQANDREFEGVAKVWEALIVGTAADVWGDVPYTEAVSGNRTPKLDNQLEIYDSLQVLLTGAIADLESGQGTGPGAYDLIYGGDAQAWIEAAHTLKARLYLHTVEASSDTPAVYGLALAEARQGISSPANDFRAYASPSAGEQNVWYQFFTNRGEDIRAGRFLVELLQQRADPRLTEYFGESDAGTYAGAAPGEQVNLDELSWLSSTRGAASFQQPVLTWAETKLIEAEALQQLGREPEARAALDAVRADAGLGSIGGAVSGEALLQAIIEEKYIALFQNIEVWSDYRRTCYPRITPFEGGEVPGRAYYPVNERNANPNVPLPNTGTNGARNRNDPNACPA